MALGARGQTMKSVFAAGFLMVLGCAEAATINVAPGDGTLADAVAAAADGDVLVLSDGTYSGTVGTVSKSLTFVAANSSSEPLISGSITLDGVGKIYVLHGLSFSSNVNYRGDPARITFLENRFLDRALNWSDFAKPANLVVLGNEFITSSPNVVHDFEAEDEIIVAGNSFSGGKISMDSINATAVFVGNSYVASLIDSSVRVFIGSAQTRIMANRFEVRLDTDFGDQVILPIILTAGDEGAQVRNNLFALTDISALGSSGVGSRVSGVQMVNVNLSKTGVEIQNNVFDLGGFDLGEETDPANGVIHSDSFIKIQSNIFVGSSKPLFTFDPDTAIGNTFRNNLCFNNANSCPTTDGNQNADPLFADTVDYQLQSGSPAIDAGPSEPFLLDLDGSVIDLGLYGGPFPIDQYDIQRDSNRTAPFIYPLFDASRTVDGLGNLRVRVVGAARLN